MHYRDGKTPLCEVVDTLEYLQNQGKIRYFGLSNIYENDKSELADLKGKFVCFQDEYSLACRKNEKDILDFASNYDLTPLTWGSLGQGILTGKYTLENIKFDSDDRRSRDIYVNFHGKKLKKNLEIVEVLKTISQKYNKSVSSVAIRFILDNIPESAVLVGIKRPNQLLGNLQAMDWNLERYDSDELRKVSE